MEKVNQPGKGRQIRDQRPPAGYGRNMGHGTVQNKERVNISFNTCRTNKNEKFWKMLRKKGVRSLRKEQCNEKNINMVNREKLNISSRVYIEKVVEIIAKIKLLQNFKER